MLHHGAIMQVFDLDRKGDNICPCCNKRRAYPGINTVDVDKPGLAAEWSPNNEFPINNYLASSRFHALWICPTCHQEYKAMIRKREVGDNICPCCNSKRPYPSINTVNVEKPELVSEWSDNDE